MARFVVPSLSLLALLGILIWTALNSVFLMQWTTEFSTLVDIVDLPAEHSSSSRIPPPPPSLPSITTTTSHITSSSRKARIDLKSCPKWRPLVAAKVDKMLGLGHKMTQFLSVWRITLVNGYCLCFDRELSPELYDLLLASLLDPCPANNVTINIETEPKDLQKTIETTKHSSATATTDDGDEHGNDDVIVFWVGTPGIWSKKFAPNGHGDALAFVDSFIRTNHLLEDIVYPHYLAARRGSAFVLENNNNNNIINAAFHIRVGDLVIESKQSYWDNLFHSMRAILDMELGKKDTVVHLYFCYFKGQKGVTYGRKERSGGLSGADYGNWSQPSDPQLLPDSHAHLADLCDAHANIVCFWKHGASIAESIDMLVTADVVYVSGSSFSQIISMFNAKAIKLIAVPKELNWHGAKTTSQVPFLSTHVSAYSSLEYYYINVDGALYQEQLAYLNLEHRQTNQKP